MARNDRIPQGVRKLANRLGPGRYMDPATRRIYVDSADMDDSFEEMIDNVANADATRIAEMERRRKLPRPPPQVQEQAKNHLLGHAERILQRREDGWLSGGGGWLSRARKRQAALLGRQRWKRQINSELDTEDLQELEDLAAAIATAEQENEDDGKQGTTSGD